MELTLNWYSVTLLFGFIHGLLFACLLMVRAGRERRYSDSLLAGLLLCGSMVILPFMLGFMDIHVLWRELLFFPQDPSFLIGPLLYFYVVSLTDQTWRLKPLQVLHLLPFGLMVIYQLIVFSLGAQAVRDWLDRVHLPYLQIPMELLILISNLAYLFLAFRHYRRYRAWLHTEFADTEPLRFVWLPTFLITLLVGIVFSWSFDLLAMVGVAMSYTDTYWKFLGISTLIYFLGFCGFSHKPADGLHFSKQRVPGPNRCSTNSDNPTDQLKPEPVDHWKNRLAAFMEQEKPYLNATVTLSELANRLGTNKNHLSQVINHQFGVNFNRFINGYRVDAFKHQVRETDLSQWTLLGVALSCGFNSKATFNRVFKQWTGVTPKTYVDDIGKQAQSTSSDLIES